jgi:hypothetical protein
VKRHRSIDGNAGAVAGLGLALAFLASAPARAAPVDTSAWECHFCPFEDGQATVEAEAGSLYADGVDA